MTTLDTAGFAELWGIDAGIINDATKSLIQRYDFSYREIVGEERDKLILEVLKRIDRDQQVIGAEERKEVWHKGWDANLQEFLLRRRIHDRNITVSRERELVGFRCRTLSHAVFSYYRNPLLAVHLVRPAAAYLVRWRP